MTEARYKEIFKLFLLWLGDQPREKSDAIRKKETGALASLLIDFSLEKGISLAEIIEWKIFHDK